MPNQRGHHNLKKKNKQNKTKQIKSKMDLRDDHDATALIPGVVK